MNEWKIELATGHLYQEKQKTKTSASELNKAMLFYLMATGLIK